MTHHERSDTHWLIVSDLDGTLLDHYDYSHAAVDELLPELEQKRIPLILNSSKTFTELMEIRASLRNQHPFIIENGSAIFIPVGYFAQKPPEVKTQDDFWVMETGAARRDLVNYLQQDARQHGAPYLAFSAATTEQIVDATGLTQAQARAAQQRHYSEPLLWQGSAEEQQAFSQRARAAGFNTLQGGRFLHLQGKSDKGSATLALRDCYARALQREFSLIAAGDSPNDLDMLEVADIAIIIRAPHRPPPELAANSNRRVIVSKSIGPEGWHETVSTLI